MTTFFAAAFGGTMLVAQLLCVKSNLFWVRGGLSVYAVICAVFLSLNFHFTDEPIRVVDNPKPVEPSVVSPEATTVAQNYLAASMNAKRLRRIIDGLDGIAGDEVLGRRQVRRDDQ